MNPICLFYLFQILQGISTIEFLGSISLEVVETKNDDQGRILILDIKICDEELLPVNLYNANTETEHSDTLTKLFEMLNSICNIINKEIILDGDFNLFFHTSLKCNLRSFAKLIGIKLWRVRNPKWKLFMFHQDNVSGHIQRRLDYYLIYIFLQETAIRPDVLASFSSNHSPITFTIALQSNNTRGKGL